MLTTFICSPWPFVPTSSLLRLVGKSTSTKPSSLPYSSSAAVTMRTVVVTGASRGIGLGLVTALLKNGDRVIATARNPEKAANLLSLCEAYQADPPLKLDMDSDDSILDCCQQIKAKNIKVDILINNAGISNSNHPVDPPNKIIRSEMLHIFNTNVVGVAKITEHIGILDTKDGIVVNISSSMGSVTLTQYASATSYRCSKAALNMLTKCYAVEFPDTSFVMIHPGWVQTDMGGAQGRAADLSIEESVTGIIKVIGGLTKQHSGKFISWKGEVLPF